LSEGVDTNTVRTAVDQKSMSAIDSYTTDSDVEKLKILMEKLVVSNSICI